MTTLKMKKKHIICLLVCVSITLMMLSCASRRSMMPRKHPHRCNDCPTFSYMVEKQNSYACSETNERRY